MTINLSATQEDFKIVTKDGGTVTVPSSATDTNLVLSGEWLSEKEDISNKVTVLLSTSTDVQYPTAKCMYDIIGNIESALDIINNGGAQ